MQNFKPQDFIFGRIVENGVWDSIILHKNTAFNKNRILFNMEHPEISHGYICLHPKGGQPIFISTEKEIKSCLEEKYRTLHSEYYKYSSYTNILRDYCGKDLSQFPDKQLVKSILKIINKDINFNI